MNSLVKRSVSIQGHRIHVSIEGPFWTSLEEIAREEATTTSKLVASIEASRGEVALSSAIRVYVIDHFVTRAHKLGNLDDAADQGRRVSPTYRFMAARPRWLH